MSHPSSASDAPPSDNPFESDISDIRETLEELGYDDRKTVDIVPYKSLNLVMLWIYSVNDGEAIEKTLKEAIRENDPEQKDWPDGQLTFDYKSIKVAISILRDEKPHHFDENA